MSETETLGSLFEEPDPQDKKQRCVEYWYWNEDATVGKMTVTRDGLGRFVEFHYYEPRVVKGEATKYEQRSRANNLGELFG